MSKYQPKAGDPVFKANAAFIAGLLGLDKANGRELRLLDVGCHKCFLKEFLPNNVRYQGINIDKTGDDVLEHDLNSGFLPVEDSTYDFVVCTDLLEHLFCPDRIAAEIRRCLVPGGTFLISLPNDLGITAFLSFHQEWFQRSIDSIAVQTFKHHWKFSRRVAIDFLNGAGLRPERTEAYFGPFLRPFSPVLRHFPDLCSTYFFVGRKTK